MSIVIKGMDMPTSCSRCPCSNDASRFCRVVEEYIPMLGKPAFCPLVDVPDTNVGDMISRQAAIDALCKRCDLVSDDEPCTEECNDIKILKLLPSTQPEGIYYVKFSEEDYEKIAEQLRKIPIVLTLSEPEIVRCAECKWFQYNMRFDGHLPKGVDEFECRHWCGSCDPTDFCSYAERKWEEDEDE